MCVLEFGRSVPGVRRARLRDVLSVSTSLSFARLWVHWVRGALQVVSALAGGANGDSQLHCDEMNVDMDSFLSGDEDKGQDREAR
jgi:hypothetical protein